MVSELVHDPTSRLHAAIAEMPEPVTDEHAAAIDETAKHYREMYGLD